MLNELRKELQDFIDDSAGIILRLGFSANQITLFGFLLALASSSLYFVGSPRSVLVKAAAVLLMLSGLCDVLDGAVAKKKSMPDPFGGFLDSTLDRLSDAAVLSAMILNGLCDLLWGLMALIGSLLVSYTRARAEASGVQMASVGFAERAERTIILAVASLLDLISYGVALLAMLTAITIIQRIHYMKSRAG